MTNQKYRALTRASRATAARDLADLEALGFLVRADGGGRSTRYLLTAEE